jgi:hypothetical protein
MGAARNLAFGLMFGLLLAPLAHASRLGKADEKKASQFLADKMTNLLQTLEMREAKLTPGAPAGTIDKNSGNASQAPTTLHTNVRSVCLVQFNPMHCQEWLDPFAPEHGLTGGGDFSPAEGMLAAAWQQRKNIDGGGQYRIWEIRRLGDNGGSNKDADGKLDLSGVVSWSVVDDVADQMRGLGKETGARTMLSTYDKNSGKGQNIMPNREALSLMAQTFTKQFRNRMVTNLGEMRAASAPSEFLLNEEIPDCEAYRSAVQVAMARQPSFEEKLPNQARLDPRSMGSLDQRYQACVAARRASVSMVNPQVQNGGVQAGDPEGEPIDQALTRLNIAAIDQAGINVTELPKPSYIQLTEKQTTSQFADFETGGLSIRSIKQESNAKTLNSYNNNLEAAAQAMKNVVLRDPSIMNNGDKIRAFKIEPGTQSAVSINGFTPEIKRGLASTSFANAPAMQMGSAKESAPQEQVPTELTITTR